MGQGGTPEIDVFEHSVPREGKPQALNERLFMQLHVFTGCPDPGPVVAAARESGFDCVVYRDLADPRGIGFLTMDTDPTHFVTRARDFLNDGPFRDLTQRPEFTMFGRTYSLGYEPNLQDWLIDKPRRTALTTNWPWVMWYPLRRTGEFATLPEGEQKEILAEHGRIGIAYGRADLGHDIRLACHGLDVRDNEFVIALVGKELHPLSHLVQRMRRTKQTSRYIRAMGPFFVGHAIFQTPTS